MKQKRCGEGRFIVRIFKLMEINIVNIFTLTGEV